MKHPLGGTWMTWEDMKRHHSWKLPLALLSISLLFIVFTIWCAVMCCIAVFIGILNRIVDWFEEQKFR